MSDKEQHYIDWGHLGFLSAIIVFIVWFLWTSAAASLTFSNLILIGPVGLFAFLLSIYLAAIEIIKFRVEPKIAQLDQISGHTKADRFRAVVGPARFRNGSLKKTFLLMGLFGLFVAAISYCGFDIASFFFLTITTWALGERRFFFIVALALCVSGSISFVALAMPTYPIPMGIARYIWRSL